MYCIMITIHVVELKDARPDGDLVQMVTILERLTHRPHCPHTARHVNALTAYILCYTYTTRPVFLHIFVSVVDSAR